MTSAELTRALASVRCLLLDFDGPVCSVFAGYLPPDVSESMRSDLLAEGFLLSETGMLTSDPMTVLLDAAAISPESGHRAETLLEAAEAVCIKSATPTPGAEQLLKTAKELEFPVVVVSNNSPAAIWSYLAAHSLDDYVIDVVGRDPSDALLMKPNPYLINLALKKAGRAAREAVLVGDSITDVIAGLAAEVAVIGYANAPQKIDALRREGAQAVITELPSLIDALRRKSPRAS